MTLSQTSPPPLHRVSRTIWMTLNFKHFYLTWKNSLLAWLSPPSAWMGSITRPEHGTPFFLWASKISSTLAKQRRSSASFSWTCSSSGYLGNNNVYCFIYSSARTALFKQGVPVFTFCEWLPWEPFEFPNFIHMSQALIVTLVLAPLYTLGYTCL